MEKLSDKRYAELKAKQEFVRDLGQVLAKHTVSITSMDYDIFESEQGLEEILLVYYDGGAYAARNCYADSKSAILDEVAKLFNGGYYDEVEDYQYFKTHSKDIQGLSL